MRVLAKVSTAQRKSTASPQEMNLDFLIIPLGVIFLGVLLLAVALVGTWFGGAMGTLAIIGAATVLLGLIMAFIPIANASSKCFYCLQ
jgi:high-affinity K+ transport system ATPase subunit B